MGKIRIADLAAPSVESQQDETKRFEKALATVREERVQRERIRLKRFTLRKKDPAADS